MIPEALRQKFASGGFPGRDSLLSRPSALRILQGLTFVVLTLILIPVLSGGLSIIILSVPLAGIGAFWLLRHPHWGVWGVLTLMTSEIKVLFGASYLLSALLLISLALAIIRERGCWLLRVPQVQIFLVIGFVFLISTGWSDFQFPITLNLDKDQTVRQAREFLTHLIWLVFFLYFINTRQKIEFTAALSVGLILAAALSAGITFVATGGAHRAEASFGLAQNSNRLAYICVFALSLVWFYRSYGSSGAWKLLCLPLLFFLPVVALTAGSRSGLLQIVMLGALILKDQRGWSPAKRISCVFFIGIVAVLIIALVPAGYLDRVTTFDAEVDAPGQESLQTRTAVVFSALKMFASEPIFGVGIGNFNWIAPALWGTSGVTHNSYLWALTSGGMGVLALYLLLFYVTYRMLRQLEKSGPRELLWLSKATKANFLLFLIFSAFADFWLSDFFYLIIGLAIAMTYLWQREKRKVAANLPGGDLSPDLRLSNLAGAR